MKIEPAGFIAQGSVKRSDKNPRWFSVNFRLIRQISANMSISEVLKCFRSGNFWEN